ncbi:DUF2694 domain-containing protein [soil metagenome]
MTEANPEFDATHPSGHLLFRSCRGGYLHSVALAEEVMAADAQTLAAAIKVTADVSYLRALMEVRSEILAAGHTPSDEVPTETELADAEKVLAQHQLFDDRD